MNINCQYSKNGNSYYMSINYNNHYMSTDYDIARLLNMEYYKYIDLIKLYNANLHSTEYYFEVKQDCEKCIEKLKENYNDRLVYLTLIEYTKEANKILDNIR